TSDAPQPARLRRAAPRAPGRAMCISWALFYAFRPRCRRDLLADERNLVVAEPPLVEPVRARDFLERVNRGLYPLRPRHGDQLDVAVDVADGENALAAGLEVRIDADAAVFVELHAQTLERVLRGQKPDLHDDRRTI